MLPKTYYGFRFKADQYKAFKKIVSQSDFTVTGALEKFMNECIHANALIFPRERVLDFEAEAAILVDWLDKGKRFYRGENGDELNIQGRLLWLLPKVQNIVLMRAIETALKKSVKATCNINSVEPDVSY